MSSLKRFSLSPLSLAGFLILFFFLLLLALWQWELYRHANRLVKAHQSSSQQTPISIQRYLTQHEENFRRVYSTGYFQIDKAFWLSHQYYKNKTGVELIVPFWSNAAKAWLLVNVGWIDANKANALLPSKLLPKGVIHIEGSAVHWNENIFSFEKDYHRTRLGVLTLDALDVPFIQSELHRSFLPFVLFLDKETKWGKSQFVRGWELPILNGKQHFYYMIQWLVMAFSLLFAFFAFSMKRKPTE